MIHTKLFSDSS